MSGGQSSHTGTPWCREDGYVARSIEDQYAYEGDQQPQLWRDGSATAYASELCIPDAMAIPIPFALSRSTDRGYNAWNQDRGWTTANDRLVAGRGRARQHPIGGKNPRVVGMSNQGTKNDSVEDCSQNGLGQRHGQHKDDRDQDGVSALRRNKWVNRQLTQIAERDSLHHLLQSIQYHLEKMNGINLVTALHRVTKLAVRVNHSIEDLRNNAYFQSLRDSVERHIYIQSGDEAPAARRASGAIEVQCMSIVCWSYATLRLHDEPLMGKITELALPHLDRLKPYELATLLWGNAKLNTGKRSLLSAVSNRLMNRHEGEFGLQCLSMIVWSFATVKCRATPMFQSLAVEIANNAHESKPQEISNTLWAYAKNQCGEVNLFKTLADAALSKGLLEQFKPQELSNTFWAFATTSVHHEDLFKTSIPTVIKKRFELAPQNIANILWSYGKLQACPHSGVFPALLAISAKNLHLHKPYEISSIVWAAAQDNDPACKCFFEDVAQACAHSLDDFPPQALGNMVEAFAIVQAATPNFLEAMVYTSFSRLHQFSPSALSNLFKGVAILSRQKHIRSDSDDQFGEILRGICNQVTMRVGDMAVSEIDNVAQSLQLLEGLEQNTPGSDIFSLRCKVDTEKKRLSRVQRGFANGTLWETENDVEEETRRCLQGCSSSIAQSLDTSNRVTMEASIATSEEQARWKPRIIPASSLVQLIQCSPMDAPSLDVVDLQEFSFASLIGTGSCVIHLRLGVLDERVVLKRAAGQNFALPIELAHSAHVLVPHAIIPAPQSGDCFIAYPYCEHATLADWILNTGSAQREWQSAARIMLDILQAAVSLVSYELDICALRADEIFIDAHLQARLRLSSRSLPPGNSAKWYSPEEAQLISPERYSTWPAAAFRIGLILYCLGAKTADPYPQIQSDLVLLSLRGEATSAAMLFRPRLSQYDHHCPLYPVMMNCLSSNPDDRPDSQALADAFVNILSSWS